MSEHPEWVRLYQEAGCVCEWYTDFRATVQLRTKDCWWHPCAPQAVGTLVLHPAELGREA